MDIWRIYHIPQAFDVKQLLEGNKETVAACAKLGQAAPKKHQSDQTPTSHNPSELLHCMFERRLWEVSESLSYMAVPMHRETLI